ncbi:UrcA family protein [Caulobacter sp. RHG1]|uniref:UrcA family protein n=1 Tax=Caulobacter sp. (strain RHG1) TaxID=2545762 RepID=UPI0015526C04|nr:UrcA family protein [Caulobacter sp. RHG1]NQE60373.1 hypothetical protein [Caulobacter sp. RHG1]
MKTLAAIAALATATILAAPAAAATSEVRVSVTGKSATQVQSEIKTAADSVCGQYDTACVDGAILNARRQLAQIHRARQAGGVPARSVSVVRIAVKGKTRDQLHAEIRTAAQTVCKAGQRATVISYQACVADTVRNAKAQLQARVGDAA